VPIRPTSLTASIVPLAILLTTTRPAAAQCPEDGATMVTLSALAGVGAGAATSLASSGIIASADPNSDYRFLTGFLVGTAVTGGLSALYGIIDGTTGCAVVREQEGFAWSIPLTMGIVGSLLPIAVWGAAGHQDEPLASSSSQLGRRPTGPVAPAIHITVAF